MLLAVMIILTIRSGILTRWMSITVVIGAKAKPAMEQITGAAKTTSSGESRRSSRAIHSTALA